MLTKVGTGFCMVNAPDNVDDPPPGGEFSTVMSRRPGAALLLMVTSIEICVELTMVTLLIVIPVPEKLTVEMPFEKPVPVRRRVRD
jgi:hypothetical protein